jgi:basic membrane protein A
MSSSRLLLVMFLMVSCKKDTPGEASGAAPKKVAKAVIAGLVTDVGGRGDQSFNDSALRGLEAWAGGVKLVDGAYRPLTQVERDATLPAELRSRVVALGVRPLVVQSKVPEDYQPNLQLLVDQGADLTVGTGFMLENAVEAVAKANPQAKFLLIDSPILDAKGVPLALANVRTVVFREEEGSFLVGALAGLVAKGKVGFVGGMDTPLIRRFEAGYRAGVRATNPSAVVLVQYTGSFDNVSAGKQAGADLVAKGCEVVFQAAGSDGTGVVQAVKEARAAGKQVFVVGTDSDQWHLAPEAMLTSMLKRVDLAVWQALFDLSRGAFTSGDVKLGLKEAGVGLAEVRVDFPGKTEALAQVEALRAQVVSGALKVPASRAELEQFQAPER